MCTGKSLNLSKKWHIRFNSVCTECADMRNGKGTSHFFLRSFLSALLYKYWETPKSFVTLAVKLTIQPLYSWNYKRIQFNIAVLNNDWHMNFHKVRNHHITDRYLVQTKFIHVCVRVFVCRTVLSMVSFFGRVLPKWCFMMFYSVFAYKFLCKAS